MIIITNANGDSITTVPENIYQGSNKANSIYWVAPIPNSSVATIIFTLPNGEQTSEILGTMQHNNLPQGYEDFSMWAFDITSAITKYYGTVKFQIYARNSSNQIIANVGSSFIVNRGVAPVLPEQPSADIYEQILEALAQIQEDIGNGWLESKALLPYDEDFTYSLNAVVSDSGNFYKSKIANNIGNPLTDTNSWDKLDFASGSDVSDLQTQINIINSKIPSNASSSNKMVVVSDIAGMQEQITNLQENKQDKLTQTQLDAVNSGINSTKVAQIQTNTNDIATINSKIPAQASSSNQLADKEFVNSSIATNTANFIGTFANITALNNYAGTVTNNDYANVINQELDFATTTEMNAYNKDLLTNYDYAWVVNGQKYDLYRFNIVEQTWNLRDTHIDKSQVALITAYNRYTYKADLQQWGYNYTVNTSGFTASQWEAINSGATAELITKIGTSTLNTTAQNLSDAINELLNTPSLPSHTISDIGKVLTINNQNEAVWLDTQNEFVMFTKTNNAGTFTVDSTEWVNAMNNDKAILRVTDGTDYYVLYKVKYDATTVYFEGSGKKAEFIKNGASYSGTFEIATIPLNPLTNAEIDTIMGGILT